MKHLNRQELFQIWEFGTWHTVLETNVFLLSFAYPDKDINQIASLSIGERDARLLSVRESLFGPVLHNTASCTSCGQKLEWESSTDALRLQSIPQETQAELLEINYGDQLIHFRLPNSHDILEIMAQDGEDDQEDVLIKKCIDNSALSDGSIQSLPDELKSMIMDKMEESDPQANIVMNLSCPDCENRWETTFDIMHYLWTEINDWAVELIHDIYLLASNFGWSEKDILSMSRFKRKLYINMLER